MNDSFENVRRNLWTKSHGAIGDWQTFPWHKDLRGEIQTSKIQSSQALAIDVFGTIKMHKDRDKIMGALAKKCDLPDDGPWQLELEWIDPDRLLNEPRPTQIDAVAFGKKSLLVIECKFTEPGGGCSQPKKITNGRHAGQRQCNGNYEVQTNPITNNSNRCALTGKGIKYWETIPRVFGINAERDFRPCPFKADAYQWMRNIVLADRLSSERNLSSAVICAYADSPVFSTAKKVRSDKLGLPTTSESPSLIPLSYQSIIATAEGVSERPEDWQSLAGWVNRKIDAASAGGEHPSQNQN